MSNLLYNWKLSCTRFHVTFFNSDHFFVILMVKILIFSWKIDVHLDFQSWVFVKFWLSPGRRNKKEKSFGSWGGLKLFQEVTNHLLSESWVGFLQKILVTWLMVEVELLCHGGPGSSTSLQGVPGFHQCFNTAASCRAFTIWNSHSPTMLMLGFTDALSHPTI